MIHKLSKRLIVCIDFDGTIVEHSYPEIGNPLPQAIEVIKEIQQAGIRLYCGHVEKEIHYNKL